VHRSRRRRRRSPARSRPDGRRPARAWAFPTNEIVRSSPSIGDIDGDARPDIVFGTGDYWARQPGGATDSVKVFALELDGRLKPGWPRTTDG